MSRFVNLIVKVKEEECKNQNYLHFGLFPNCFVSKVEAQNNVEAFHWLACNGGGGNDLFLFPS